MSKEDSSRGLLSKMVRFVRNPTTQWSELDAPEEDGESLARKQQLKEMIERKRQNDFVRKREFEQLRKLRRRETVQPLAVDSVGRTTYFHSHPESTPLDEQRAVTLKKIDEIEEQMSQQWWKGRPDGEGPLTPPQDAKGLPPGDAQHDGTPREFAQTAPLTMPPLSMAPTQPMPLQSLVATPAALAASAAQAQAQTAALQATVGGSSIDFGALASPVSQQVPPVFRPQAIVPTPEVAVPEVAAPEVEPEIFVHEPDLEEAAIRFANGDYADAETGLLDVLRRHAKDDSAKQFDIWMTLFDLYRATGQQDRFDVLSMDFATRFSRSAPLWFSMPAQLGAGLSEETETTTSARGFQWSAPAVITSQTVASLQAMLARSPAPPWAINWTRAISVDDAALGPLTALCTQWGAQDIELNFVGVTALHAMLQSKTPSGDREINEAWWRLRMALLRLMGAADEFELVALDYCVTYEVSPPSWASPRCRYTGDDGTISGPAPLTPHTDYGDLSVGLSRPATLAEMPTASLQGQIDGDAVPLLQPFETMAQPGMPLVVSCDRLIRMDFPAAGSVLNWAAEQQGKGRVVHFTNLHRLLAVFFNVIGVSDHARVVPRKN